MDDLISRQDAIDVADAIWSVTGDKNVAKVWYQIKDLPSAQPEERALHESCTDCPLYDKDRHSCPRFNKVIPETLRELQSAQSEQKLWKERYEDLLEYFHGEDIILKDRKEFKTWLERCLWHVRECDKLARQLEAQTEIIRCRECQHWKQGELVDKCGLLDCYADADCYCALAVRERRQDDGRSQVSERKESDV